jgi:hypothetical protein
MADPASLPPEALPLLSVPPSEFVAERGRVAKELRSAGRPADAQAVARLRKPPKRVVALNRAARALPADAEAAAKAAADLAGAQAAARRDAFDEAHAELESASDALVERAAREVEGPVDPSRLRALLRAALATEPGRAAMTRGALTELIEPTGFEALAGLPLAAPGRRREARPSAGSRRDEARRQRREALEGELAEARAREREAVSAAREARRAEEAARTRVQSLERQLERLEQT